ncbi:hypothetical protein EJ06DRAFT_522639 [Trichodelitschia bisporula]|uniref:Tcp11-domain-containing protein n=1 Tax=Trichodelitschia bisporula TaxID=703511 RepID=A0A6G1HT84_9PEZI|nr:hypothetical protein EJ06DRAFT_522639 [Trichodelitschia bisporula]
MASEQPPQQVQLPSLPPNDDIPEECEDLTVSDSAGHAFAPPARIAARFYRPPNHRRKSLSSAASSRRNSMSSVHSQLSNSSYRAACRSNHVAQYLRRASILESRKARLAAREAHAEQVRIRAALAKSMPRGSNSEERALAAQQAREKHLAQVAASCAEEVRRAKKVAEEMKERRAAEEERYRLEMEEKLADAERRRLEYKRNTRRPRTASYPATNEGKKPVIKAPPKMDSEVAATCIQRAWRTGHRKAVLDEFAKLGLTIDKVHDTTFEDISGLLLNEKVLGITAKVLGLYELHENDQKATDISTSTKNFLTAYLILGHPAAVFTKDGEQEQDLITKAKDLVICFEATVSKSTTFNRFRPGATQIENLHLAHATFLTAFGDWKSQDASALIDIMVASFVNLDAIWQTVKDDTDGGVADDYRNGIRENQLAIYSKIRKLAGHDRANMLIKKAIRESRRARLRRKPVGDVRPRVADSHVIHPEASDGSDAVTVTAETTSHLAQPVSPDGSQANALTRLFSVIPDNRVLTHELAIDKEYRIDVGPHSDLRDALNRQVCDSMRRGYEQGEGDAWTMAMAQNIRSKLLHLLGSSKPDNSLKTLISEVLDPEHVQRQCEQGVFSYQNFFSFMASILPKLCAPFRDAEVQALATDLQTYGNLEEMIEKLFKLLHMIDLLSLDYSNFLLASVAPRLIKEAAGYEQRAFARDLAAGKISLSKTRRWWKNAAVNVVTEADRRDPRNMPTNQKIYARGLVDLAIATTPLKLDDLPETLEMDAARIARFRADTVRVVFVGAVLLTAKNLLKRDVRVQWKAQAARMCDVIKAARYSSEDVSESGVAARLMTALESAHAMPAATRAQLQGTISRLLPQAETGRLTDPVMKVLFQRLRAHVFGRLGASSSGERVRQASVASEGLAGSGLAEFIALVGEVVEGLGRVSEVDRRAHGGWYEEVAREVEGLGEEEAMS